jgi:hypothetical protein
MKYLPIRYHNDGESLICIHEVDINYQLLSSYFDKLNGLEQCYIDKSAKHSTGPPNEHYTTQKHSTECAFN